MSHQLKILHVITTINRGGAENHLTQLSLAQKELGHSVKIAYLHGDNYWKSFLNDNDIESIPLNLNRYGELKPALKLREIIKEYQPDIVHAHMPPAELYVKLSTIGISKKDYKLIISKHIDAPFSPGPSSLSNFLSRWSSKNAKKIICISNSTKDYFLNGEELKVNQEKYETIHYGINPDPYRNVSSSTIESLRKEFLIEDDEFVLGCVARLTPQKSLPTLINAAKLLKDNNIKFKLVMVGIGELEQELKQLVSSLGLDKEIIFTGFREDIPELMNFFDIFVLPSLYEGLGLVFLEAMAAGKPVITCNTSAMPEIVSHEKTGFLIPIESPEIIKTKVIHLLNNQNFKTFEQPCKEWVDNNFTVQKMVERTLKVYTS